MRITKPDVIQWCKNNRESLANFTMTLMPPEGWQWVVNKDTGLFELEDISKQAGNVTILDV